jgi:L-threonylcarbamoyladenylate synthase
MAVLPREAGVGYLFFNKASRDRWRALLTPPAASCEVVRDVAAMASLETGGIVRDLAATAFPQTGAVEILSEQGDTLEAAANLFDCLHRLDKQGLRRIHAETAPPQALGEAINDRLTRAAARPN